MMLFLVFPLQPPVGLQGWFFGLGATGPDTETTEQTAKPECV